MKPIITEEQKRTLLSLKERVSALEPHWAERIAGYIGRDREWPKGKVMTQFNVRNIANGRIKNPLHMRLFSKYAALLIVDSEKRVKADQVIIDQAMEQVK